MSQKNLSKIHSVNTLYLMINRIYGFTEEGDGCKYLNISSTDRNKKVFRSLE